MQVTPQDGSRFATITGSNTTPTHFPTHFIDAITPPAHPPAMREIAEDELATLGREAAAQVPGLGTVDRVKVKFGQDSTDQPAYFFTFLIDRDRDRRQGGLPRARLVQRLRDELIARDDNHYPIVTVLNQADRETLEGA